MTDLAQLKARIDLRRLVERDLGAAPRRGGRAWSWQCPFHDEHKGYSLAVWEDGFCCFGRCNLRGDAVDWLMRYRGLSFIDAVAALAGSAPTADSTRPVRPRRMHAEPPPADWQRRVERIVDRAEETLWSSAGEHALSYLLNRGLTPATIRRARLGYLPGDYREHRTLEGLEVPCGIAIPWFAADALWTLKVRRAAGMPKYLQIAGGSSGGLYNADDLPHRDIAVFTEGEFDALIVAQECQGVAAVTLGSAASTLSLRWLAELVHCRLLLVAYDRDDAGTTGARRLLRLSPRFRRLTLPHGNDITDFHTAGGEVCTWIEAAVAGTAAENTEGASRCKVDGDGMERQVVQR